jgi:hypothetical protein
VSFKPYIRSVRNSANVVSVTCHRVQLAGLKGFVWQRHWTQVEVQVEGLENVAWPPETKMLDFAAKGLKGIARLGQEPVDQIALWKRVKDVLIRLMDLGWQIHAGSTAGLLVIVFTKRDVAQIDADVEWESDPDLRGCQIIDDWFDGLQLLYRRR